MESFLSDCAMVTFLAFFTWLGWRSGKPKTLKRPGFIERHPNGSRQGRWGPEPRLGQVRRAYFSVRRAKRWSGHGSLPRRPRL